VVRQYSRITVGTQRHCFPTAAREGGKYTRCPW
jgi:hypothetical protein